MTRDVDTDRGWNEVPHRIRCGRALGEPWESLFGRVAARVDRGRPDRPVARWPHRHAVRPVALHQRPGRASPTCIACARWSMPSWSAPARCAPTIRSSRCARSQGPNPGARGDRSARHAARLGARLRRRRRAPHRHHAAGHAPCRRGRRRDDRPARHRRPHRPPAAILDALAAARPAPRPDRRRGADGVAFPVRRLPRPPACRGGADDPGLGHRRPRPAADRAHGRGVADADAAPMRWATTCCSTATCQSQKRRAASAELRA